MAVTINAKNKGFLEVKETALDLNSVNDRSTVIDLGSMSSVQLEFKIITGVLGSAVLRLECSCDDVTYFDVTTDITAEGLSIAYTIKVRYLKVYVQTASGSAATFDLIFNIKI